jgi:hypothetical protein
LGRDTHSWKEVEEVVQGVTEFDAFLLIVNTQTGHEKKRHLKTHKLSFNEKIETENDCHQSNVLLRRYSFMSDFVS